MPIVIDDDHEIYRDGERIMIPRDGNHSPTAFLSGFDSNDDIVFARFTPEGRLKIDASVTIDSIDIGDVNTMLKVGGVNRYWGGVLNPDATTYAGYVQDQRMSFTGAALNVSASQAGVWDIRHITGTVSLPTGASTLAEQQLQTTRLISLDGKDFATHAEQVLQTALLTNLDGTDFSTHAEQVLQTTRLVSLDGKDFATQATLAAIKSQTDLLTFLGDELKVSADLSLTTVGIENAADVRINPATEDTLSAFKTAFDSRDLATQTTLALVKAKTDNLDVALSSRATEATLAAVKTQTDKMTFTGSRLLVDAEITFPSLTDFPDVGAHARLDTLIAKDFATQTTLLAFKTAFDSRDLSTETTLSAFKTAFDSRDLATETTLAGVLTTTAFQARINTLGQKTMGLSTPVVLASDQSAIPASQSGTWSVRAQDGAGNLLTSTLVNTRQALDVHQADTSFIVSGLTAVGAVPSLNPLSMAGVDIGGLKRHLLTDTSGRLVISGEVTTTSPTYVTGTARALSLDLSGNLRVTPSSVGATSPGTIGAGESGNNRAYQTTFEITLGNAGVEGNILLLRNPAGSGKKAYIRSITFGNTTGASKSSTLRVYANPTLSTAAVTFTDATNLVTHAGHTFVNGDVASFATIVGTTGIVINTFYYIISVVAGASYQVSLTLAGPAIDLITNGTGTIRLPGNMLAPTSMNIGGGAPTPVLLTSTNTITSANGTKITVAAQTNEQAIIDYDWGLILNAGQTALLTGTGTANNVPLVVNVIWSEAT